jgi:hypothetical protein
MIVLLALVPILAIMAGLLLYTQSGKKEILRFDLVQFFNTFILLPVVYVWFKSFLYFLLQTEFSELITQASLLFWDTLYSVLFLFLYAFMVVHSLTKSFQLKRDKDPLYDLFEHSEYYHLWVTHTIIFVVGMFIALLLAALNAWIDLPWSLSTSQFYIILIAGLITAGLVFKAFLISDFGDWRFVKLMKLFSGIFLVLHIGVYAIFEPSFTGEKAMFWYQLITFFGLTTIGLLHESEPTPLPVHRRIKNKFSWLGKKFFGELKKLSGRFRK